MDTLLSDAPSWLLPRYGTIVVASELQASSDKIFTKSACDALADALSSLEAFVSASGHERILAGWQPLQVTPVVI